MKAQLAGVALLVLLAGCQTTAERPEFTRHTVTVTFEPGPVPAEFSANHAGWTDCGLDGHCTIYGQPPRTWDGSRMCLLGHELAHAFGAEHE